MCRGSFPPDQWKANPKIKHADSPNCWMARSALHGSSKVMWTLRLWFFTRLSACREIPELAASEMMATSCKEQRLRLFIIWLCISLKCRLIYKQDIWVFNCWVWPSLHSWNDLSPWCWCFRWSGPARPGTHNVRCHRDAAQHDPFDQSSKVTMFNKYKFSKRTDRKGYL